VVDRKTGRPGLKVGSGVRLRWPRAWSTEKPGNPAQICRGWSSSTGCWFRRPRDDRFSGRSVQQARAKRARTSPL